MIVLLTVFVWLVDNSSLDAPLSTSCSRDRDLVNQRRHTEDRSHTRLPRDTVCSGHRLPEHRRTYLTVLALVSIRSLKGGTARSGGLFDKRHNTEELT